MKVCSRTLKVALACSLLAGCGLADKIKDQLDDLLDDVQIAFDTVKGSAKAAGGDAMLVTAGEAALLEITDETSPIYGASVELPADALPAGVTQAVVSIVPGNISGAGLQTAAAAASSEYTASGPAIEIALQTLPKLETIQPAVECKVTVPLKDVEAGLDTEVTAAVGHFTGSDTFELLTSTVNTAGDRVSANTPSFSPFAAVRRVAQQLAIQPVYFSYAVTKFADANVYYCQGQVEINSSTPVEVTYETIDDSTSSKIKVFFRSGNIRLYYEIDDCTYTEELPGSTPVDPNFEGICSFSKYEFSCAQTSVTLNGDGPASQILAREIGFSNFTSTGSTRVDCHQANTKCDRHVGTVQTEFDLKFYENVPNQHSGVAHISFDALANGKWDVYDDSTAP